MTFLFNSAVGFIYGKIFIVPHPEHLTYHTHPSALARLPTPAKRLHRQEKSAPTQKIRAELLFKQFEDIKHVYYYSLELGKIFSTNYDKDVARVKLALWYNKIEEYGYDTFTTVANSIENHYERILNFFVNRSTNAAAEAFNAKIKAFRASFRGVVDMSFFLFRLAKVYA